MRCLTTSRKHMTAAMEASRALLDKVLLAILGVLLSMLLLAARTLPAHLSFTLCANAVLSAGGYWVAKTCLQSKALHEMFINARLSGIDLNKTTTKRDADGVLVRPIEGVRIPESQGTISSTVYILVLSVFIPFAFAGYVGGGSGPTDFPYQQLATYLSALLSIGLAAFMGFAVRPSCLLSMRGTAEPLST